MKLRFTSRFTIPTSSTILLAAAACVLLLFRLGSLLPGLAGAEQQLPSVHDSLHHLWNDPISLPYTLCQLVVALILPGSGYTASRLPSVLLGLILVGLSYWLLRQWYGQRLAIFGTLLLMTSPWFLHVSRLATSSILYPLVLTLIVVQAIAWHRQERARGLLYVSAILLPLTMYVSGMIWLVLPLLLIERRNFLASIRDNQRHAGLGTLLVLVMLTPLLHGFWINHHSFLEFLGWTGPWPGLVSFAQNIGLVWVHIFAGWYDKPTYNLAPLAAVNLMIALAFVVGIYLYAQHATAPRSRLLLIWWLVGTVLIALPNTINLSLLLPLVVILSTGGLGYLLHLWLKVFPRNPLARGFGIGLMAIVVFFAVAFNLRAYYIAWPHNHATRQAFSRKL